MLLDIATYLTETRDPHVIARMLLRDHRFPASISRDAISLRPCTEIDSYHFEQSEPGNCTRNQPIKFMYQHTKKSGFLNELSHQIVDEP